MDVDERLFLLHYYLDVIVVNQRDSNVSSFTHYSSPRAHVTSSFSGLLSSPARLLLLNISNYKSLPGKMVITKDSSDSKLSIAVCQWSQRETKDKTTTKSHVNQCGGDEESPENDVTQKSTDARTPAGAPGDSTPAHIISHYFHPSKSSLAAPPTLMGLFSRDATVALIRQHPPLHSVPRELVAKLFIISCDKEEKLHAYHTMKKTSKTSISFLPNRHKRRGKKDDAVIMRATSKSTAPEETTKEKRAVRFAGSDRIAQSRAFVPAEEEHPTRRAETIEEMVEEIREELRDAPVEAPQIKVHEIIEITDEENYHRGLSRVRYQEPPASSPVQGVREHINEQGEAIIDVTDIDESQVEKGRDPPQVITRFNAPSPPAREQPVDTEASRSMVSKGLSCDQFSFEGIKAHSCDASAFSGLQAQLTHHAKRLGASLSLCTNALGEVSGEVSRQATIPDDDMDKMLGVVEEDLKKGSADPNVQDVNRDSFIIFLGEELEKATCGIDRNDPNQEAFELLPQEKIDAINRLLGDSSALAREAGHKSSLLAQKGFERSSVLAQQGFERSSVLAREGYEKTSEFARQTFTKENLRFVFPEGKMEEIKHLLATQKEYYLTPEKFDAVAKMLECGVLTNVVEMKFLEEDIQDRASIIADPPAAGEKTREVAEIDIPEQLFNELAEILECSNPNSLTAGRNRSTGINAFDFSNCSSIGTKQLDALTKMFLCGLGLDGDAGKPRITDGREIEYRTRSTEVQQGGRSYDDDSLGDEIYYKPVPRVMGIAAQGPSDRRHRSQEPSKRRKNKLQQRQPQRRYRSEEPTRRRVRYEDEEEEDENDEYMRYDDEEREVHPPQRSTTRSSTKQRKPELPPRPSMEQSAMASQEKSGFFDSLW